MEGQPQTSWLGPGRDSGARSRWLLVVAVGALMLLVAAVLAAEGASSASADRRGPVATGNQARDYGDATDGGPARYQGRPGVEGDFPARSVSNGARHRRAGALKLGRRVDREGDSRQINLDLGDDGFVADLESCERSTLFFAVDASDLPDRFLSRDDTAYLNAWFDWNRDGDWRDSVRCSNQGSASAAGAAQPAGGGQGERIPEWRVENRAIDLRSFERDPVQLIRLRVRAGPVVGDLWQRASVTLNERFAERVDGRRNDGRGSFRHGETEDYLVHFEPSADCTPGLQFALHDAGQISGTFQVDGQAPTAAAYVGQQLLGGYTIAAGPAGWALNIPEDPPKGIDGGPLDFQLTSAVNGRTVVVTCFAVVFHDEKPPVRGPGSGGGDGGGDGGGGGGGQDEDEKEFATTIRCPDNVDDPPGEYIFTILVPSDATNVRHQFLQPTGPLCPGTSGNFPGVLQDPAQGPPTVPQAPSGQRYVRIRVNVQPSKAGSDPTPPADGPTQPVRIRLTWD